MGAEIASIDNQDGKTTNIPHVYISYARTGVFEKKEKGCRAILIFLLKLGNEHVWELTKIG
jgi:hypothetical protein